MEDSKFIKYDEFGELHIREKAQEVMGRLSEKEKQYFTKLLYTIQIMGGVREGVLDYIFEHHTSDEMVYNSWNFFVRQAADADWFACVDMLFQRYTGTGKKTETQKIIFSEMLEQIKGLFQEGFCSKDVWKELQECYYPFQLVELKKKLSGKIVDELRDEKEYYYQSFQRVTEKNEGLKAMLSEMRIENVTLKDEKRQLEGKRQGLENKVFLLEQKKEELEKKIKYERREGEEQTGEKILEFGDKMQRVLDLSAQIMQQVLEINSGLHNMQGETHTQENIMAEKISLSEKPRDDVQAVSSDKGSSMKMQGGKEVEEAEEFIDMEDCTYGEEEETEEKDISRFNFDVILMKEIEIQNENENNRKEEREEGKAEARGDEETKFQKRIRMFLEFMRERRMERFRNMQIGDQFTQINELLKGADLSESEKQHIRHITAESGKDRNKDKLADIYMSLKERDYFYLFSECF